MAAGRRLAKRVVIFQSLVTVGLALVALLLFDTDAALGAMVGGGVLVLGNAVVGWLSFNRPAPAAGYALRQLVIGLVVKVVLAIVVLFVGIAVMKLPGLAVVAGLIAAEVAFAVAGATQGN